ncbi:MAG: hypothetical protein ACXW3L_04270 [Limisphaerales bacterium]
MFWRYLKTSFLFWFGLIWAFVGTPFLLFALWSLTGYPGQEHLPPMNKDSAELTLVFGIVGLIFDGVGWYLVYRGYSSTRKTVELMRSGSIAQGQVTAVEINRLVKINGRHPRYLKYRFTDCNGIAREGRGPNLPLRLEGKWTTGDAVTIIYDLRNGDNHQPDLFGLRR